MNKSNAELLSGAAQADRVNSPIFHHQICITAGDSEQLPQVAQAAEFGLKLAGISRFNRIDGVKYGFLMVGRQVVAVHDATVKKVAHKIKRVWRPGGLELGLNPRR